MLWFGIICHCFPILARKLEGQLNIYQRWREAESGDTVSRGEKEGLNGERVGVPPPPRAQILRNAAQSLRREGLGECHRKGSCGS